MTEIPEHLLERAQRAREYAASNNPLGPPPTGSGIRLKDNLLEDVKLLAQLDEVSVEELISEAVWLYVIAKRNSPEFESKVSQVLDAWKSQLNHIGRPEEGTK